MGKLLFVTYASSVYRKNIFWNRLFVKLFIRPDITMFLTDDDLHKSRVYHDNRAVFDAIKGGGYWAWKPWVILKALERLDDGDIVLYQDCGKGLKYKNFRRPVNIISRAMKNDIMPGVLVSTHGNNKKWTHSKCFELMGCHSEKYYNSPQVEASISAWKVCKKSKIFVREWLSYCLNLQVVGDQVVAAGNTSCERHRYDQSILTNLVIKYGLKPIQLSFSDMHFSKSMSLVDLDIGNEGFLKKTVLNLVLVSARVKRYFVEVVN